MSRRTLERASDGSRPVTGAQKNQPRRARRPTGAECRIQRVRRPTGSDAGKLSPASARPVKVARGEKAATSGFFRPATASRDGNIRSLAYAVRPCTIASAPAARSRRTLPGFEPRAEQAALAAAVEHALATGEHLVAEAGTGTGKSLAYLLPALESGRRVVVATATKALQEQLLAPRRAGRGARRSGARSRRRRAQGPPELPLPQAAAGLRADAARATAATRRAWEAMQPWLDETETGDRAELDVRAVGGALGRARRRRRPLRGTALPVPRRPASPRPRATRAGEAELVIANHALYFADLAAGGGVLPEHDAVVFDEAHRLEETAATWLGGRVSRAGPAAARARRRARLPRGRRAAARRVSSTGSSGPATGCSAPSRRRPAAGACASSPSRRRSS